MSDDQENEASVNDLRKSNGSPVSSLDDKDAQTTPDLDDLDDEQAAALALLAHLKLEHRRIDQEITALLETGVSDMLKISRMKKIKLSIKDQIAYLENQTTPDIIA